MTETKKGYYTIKFRCPNCGDIFPREIRKGTPAKGAGGFCPTCGLKDGTPNVGNFEVIRKYPEYDSKHSGYNAPKM